MIIQAAGWSHCGRVRTGNDDHFCVGSWVEQGAAASLQIGADAAWFRDYGLLCAVADGMGGYEGGALASRVMLEALSGLFYAEKRAGADAAALRESVQKCFDGARRVLEHALRREPQLAQAGTTLAGIALLPPDVLVVFHVGDSRVLRWSGGYARALTIDHSPVAADILAGRLSEEAAAALPIASQITRSLGIEGDGTLEIGDEAVWKTGESFLLGSDGWHGLGRGLSQRAVRDALRDQPDARPAAMVQSLVSQAVQHDGQDNATLVMVSLHEDEASFDSE